MIAVVQRVTEAAVRVGDEVVGAIGPGLLALVAVHRDDGPADVAWTAGKLAGLRVFRVGDKDFDADAAPGRRRGAAGEQLHGGRRHPPGPPALVRRRVPAGAAASNSTRWPKPSARPASPSPPAGSAPTCASRSSTTAPSRSCSTAPRPVRPPAGDFQWDLAAGSLRRQGDRETGRHGDTERRFRKVRGGAGPSSRGSRRDLGTGRRLPACLSRDPSGRRTPLRPLGMTSSAFSKQFRRHARLRNCLHK